MSLDVCIYVICDGCDVICVYLRYLRANTAMLR